MITAGEFTVASFGSSTIYVNSDAPIGLVGDSISSSGLSLGNEVGTPIGLFSKTKGDIYFDQPMRGNTIKELFSRTKIIHSQSFGSLIKYSRLQGFDQSGSLLWHADTKGTCLCAGMGGSRFPFNLK